MLGMALSFVTGFAHLLVFAKKEDVMLEQVHQHIVNELQQSARTDTIFVVTAVPPRLSPANIVNIFKGFTGRRLRQEFPSLLKHHRERVWTRTYYVGTAGSVSAETIQAYIQQQERE